MVLRSKKPRVLAILAVVLAAIFLAACSSETDPVADTAAPTVGPTAEPAVAPTPTPTPVPYEDFADTVLPPADPDSLAQLTSLLSLVPEGFSSAVYLDMEFLRSSDTLAEIINLDVLGIDVALPSIATGLVDSIAVAADFQTQDVITAFQSDFAIGDMLRLASGFGLDLGGDGPLAYEGHDIWDIDALGTVVAMGTASATTGVAASGRGFTAADARALAEDSLDAFDGRTPTLLDRPGLVELLAGAPSGFASVALSQCGSLPLLEGVPGLSGCTGAVASAGSLPGDLIVFHFLIGFADQDEAAAAIQLVAGLLEGQKEMQTFEDLGVRQEGQNVRARVIVDAAQFTRAFELFAPRD